MPKNSLYSDTEAQLAANLVEIIYCNPFMEDRQRLNQKILGKRYKSAPEASREGIGKDHNIGEQMTICESLLESGRAKLMTSGDPSGHPQIHLYEHLVYFYLFHKLAPSMDQFIANCIEHPDKNLSWPGYRELEKGYDYYFSLKSPLPTTGYTKAQLASFIYQIRRAFYHTQNALIGQSEAMTKLRARVWQSVFTHDMRRYLRSLYNRMENVFTLIEGPSGSGKELVARAIGFSRFIPFEESMGRFAENYRQVFYPINLSALSETLVESELFGHQKGAFTGALQNRAGFFESCGAFGTVFLDEIGDTEPSIQVKLLRVLQTRQFQRLGDTTTHYFTGKVMAATNRKLEEEMRNGNFRTDFYYRLCADRIETPDLASMLSGKRNEIEILVCFIAEKLAGPEERDGLTEEATQWIRKNMPCDYAWPGNFRELEQCVRNIMVHGEYHPQKDPSKTAASSDLHPLETPTLNQWIQRLVNREYARTPNLAQVADRLQVDRRTVRKYLRLNP